MANNIASKLLFLAVLLAPFMASMTMTKGARPLSMENPKPSNLVARLKLDNESTSCWDSLMQLQACTGELIMFFLNGETHLGRSCCQAIRTISLHCWPTMIDTLGFTPQETDILQGYCASEAPPQPPTVVPVKVVQLPPLDSAP